MLTPSIFVSAGDELDIFDVLRRECSCLLESLMSRLRFQGVDVRERTRLRLVVDHSLSIWPGGLHTWSSYLAIVRMSRHFKEMGSVILPKFFCFMFS